MSYELFWYGVPQDYFTYMRAYQLKQEVKDADSYRDGLYTLAALNQALHGAFSKNSKQIYPNKPFSSSNQEKSNISLQDKIMMAMFGKKRGR